MFDSHAHINFKAFKGDGDDVIKKALENNTWMINVGSQHKTSQRAVEYAEKYDEGVWAAVGIHPLHVGDVEIVGDVGDEKIFFTSEAIDRDGINITTKTNEMIQYFLPMAKNKEVVAIGEVGLDYHHFNSDSNNTNEHSNDSNYVQKIIKKQKRVLAEFIELANEVSKPVILHCWGADSRDKDLIETDAYDDLLEILEKNSIKKLGVIHSFIGSWKTAQKFIELGYKIGLNGIVTYSESYDKLIRNIDIGDLLIETDCPYLNPKPLPRDGRNEPVNVKYIAEKIAEVKGVEVSEVEETTTDNARKLFGI